MTRGTRTVAVVVPVHGNAPTLEDVARRSLAALAGEAEAVLVFVDDASTDASWSVIVALAERHPAVAGVRLDRRSGQMAAIVEGVDAADADLVVCLDADLECPPEALPGLLAGLRAGADLVSTVRVGRESRRLHRRLGYWLVRALLSRRVRRNLTDVTSGMKGWRHHVSAPMSAEWDRTYVGFIESMVSRAARVENIDVRWNPSAAPSAYRPRDVVKLARTVLEQRMSPGRPSTAVLMGVLVGAAVAVGALRRDRPVSATLGGNAVAQPVVALAMAALRRRSRRRAHERRPPRPRVVELVGALSDR